MTRPPFEHRLAAAQYGLAEVARTGVPPLPTPLRDQIEAAIDDVGKRILPRAAKKVTAALPDAHWHSGEHHGYEPQRNALLLAALEGCTERCPHMPPASPQPVVVRLAWRHASCESCNPSTDLATAELDQCDFCDARPVERFLPIMLNVGLYLFIGDACSTCAPILVGGPIPDGDYESDDDPAEPPAQP